jgi:hypothetical protein
MEQKIIEFFNTHPDATEVHSALGVLFTDKEKAEAYLGGVPHGKVETITREQSEAAPVIDIATDPNLPGKGVDETKASEKDQEAKAVADALAAKADRESKETKGKEPLTPEELEQENAKMLQGGTAKADTNKK